MMRCKKKASSSSANREENYIADVLRQRHFQTFFSYQPPALYALLALKWFHNQWESEPNRSSPNLAVCHIRPEIATPLPSHKNLRTTGSSMVNSSLPCSPSELEHLEITD